MGQETEYALAGFDHSGARVAVPRLVDSLMTTAYQRLPHLPSREGAGMFLATGGRFYIDAGAHPELTTPECPNPWDVARYIKAGERILVSLASGMRAANPSFQQVMFFRSNVDYSGSGNTWGCHESYLHRCHDLELMRQEIVPHLVSRIIYTGAGGLDPVSPGILFVLSPRVVHLQREVSEQTTSYRAIFNTRQEHHASDGYRRLHLICGESLFSETAMFLKAGTTMLIVAMVENGRQPSRGLRLQSPLDAMRRYGRDPTCQITSPLADGRALSAVQIQRLYLECAEQNLPAPWMPPWAAEVCQQWRAILDRLGKDAPSSVATRLDWAIKYSLFANRLGRCGRTFESVGRWTSILEQLANQFPQIKSGPLAPLWKDLLGRDGSLGVAIEALTPSVRRRGLSWDDLADLMGVRQELFEIDVRCSQLGPGGVLTRLDGAGVLRHHFQGVDNFDHAMVNPPDTGRARLRGQFIQRHSGHKARFHCDWTQISDSEKKQVLDLSDPFATEEKWIPQSSWAPDSGGSSLLRIMNILEQAMGHFDTGHYPEAYRLVQSLRHAGLFLPFQEARDYLRLKAWLESRLGLVTGPSTLTPLRRGGNMDFQLVNDHVSVYRYQGLTPAPEIWEWIERGKSLIEQGAQVHRSTLVAFWGHSACALKSVGRVSEAAELLQGALEPEYRADAHPHVLSRALDGLGDIKRLQGDPQAAAGFLAEAQDIQTRQRYRADLADFTYTYQAKLCQQSEEALARLTEAREIQRQLQNRMGEARTLVLTARLAHDPHTIEELKRQIEQLRSELPALGGCALLGKILARWTEWTGHDRPPDDHGDFYWGV